jgi:DHA3 family macrolide efflux protein-like MFS transporter
LRLWIGQMISAVGDYFYFLAIPILVERLTGSALLVGLSIISSSLPMLLLGPIAGVFVDRWDRKKTMIVADVLRGLLVLLCLLVRTPELIWVFYVVGFLMSYVSRFFYPSQAALLPRLVGDADDLLAANGLMQVVMMVALVAGPALAGFAIGLFGAQVAFVVDSVSFFISALCISTMYVAHRPAERAATTNRVAAVWTELRAGIAHLFASQTLKRVILCLVVVQLGIGAINVLFVPFLQRLFQANPQEMGIVDAAQGIGMVLGGIALGFVVSRLRKNALIGIGIIVIGVLIAGMGAAPTLVFIVACCFILGLALTPVESALTTVMQLAVPDDRRGRVNSVMNALTTAASLISMAAAAGLGEVIGLRTIYIACGFIVLLSGLLAFRIPEPAPVAEREEPVRVAAPVPAPAEQSEPAGTAGREVAVELDPGGMI